MRLCGGYHVKDDIHLAEVSLFSLKHGPIHDLSIGLFFKWSIVEGIFNNSVFPHLERHIGSCVRPRPIGSEQYFVWVLHTLELFKIVEFGNDAPGLFTIFHFEDTITPEHHLSGLF